MAGKERVLGRPSEKSLRTGHKSPIRIRYLLVAGVVVWAGIHYAHQRASLFALQTKQASLTHQLTALQSQHDKLMTQSKEFQDKNFIISYAEKEFNLVLPGQVSFDIRH